MPALTILLCSDGKPCSDFDEFGHCVNCCECKQCIAILQAKEDEEKHDWWVSADGYITLLTLTEGEARLAEANWQEWGGLDEFRDERHNNHICTGLFCSSTCPKDFWVAQDGLVKLVTCTEEEIRDQEWEEWGGLYDDGFTDERVRTEENTELYVCCVGCGETVCWLFEEPDHKDDRGEAVCADCIGACGCKECVKNL